MTEIEQWYTEQVPTLCRLLDVNPVDVHSVHFLATCIEVELFVKDEQGRVQLDSVTELPLMETKRLPRWVCQTVNE